MKPKIILSFIIVAMAALPDARGQSIGPSVMNSNGGSGTAAGNTFEWSIGELMVHTSTSASVIVTEGVLQPNMSTTGVGTVSLASQLDVFPNPSSSIVNIKFTAPHEGTLYYRLVDVLGRVLQESTAEVRSGITTRQLDITSLACASYMLHVTYKTAGAQQESTTYKIQKLN